MAAIYATLVIKGLRTLEQVPALLRKQAEDYLAVLEAQAQ